MSTSKHGSADISAKVKETSVDVDLVSSSKGAAGATYEHGSKTKKVDVTQQATVLNPSYSDWNHWDFSDVDPVVKRRCRIIKWTLISVIVVGLLATIILFGAFSFVNEFDENAIVEQGSRVYAVSPGRHFVLTPYKIHRFPRFEYQEEFIQLDGTEINMRVRDGQVISVDVSVQYLMPINTIDDIFEVHRTDFPQTFRRVMQSVLHDTASQYVTADFFRNRTMIGTQLRAVLEEEARKRGVELTGFQVRNVILPEAYESRLVDVELRQLEQKAGTARLELERIWAESNRTVLSLKTNTTKLLTELELETKRQVAVINRERDRVQEYTKQLLTEIEEEGKRNISLFDKETEGLIEGIELQIAVEQADMNRMVEAIEVSLSTNISVFDKETDNIKLNYENDIAQIQERTRQNTSRIIADAERQEEEFLANFERQLAQVQQEAEQLLSMVREQVNDDLGKANADALRGLPIAAFLAEEFGEAALGSVKYMDVDTPEQLRLEHLTEANLS